MQNRKIMPRMKRVTLVGVVTVGLVGGINGLALASPSVPNIGPGSTNTVGVGCVQGALNSASRNGRLPKYIPVDIDGQYGSITEQMVSLYQSNIGIQQDGIVGPVTGSYLYQEMMDEQDQIGATRLYQCLDAMPTADISGPTF